MIADTIPPSDEPGVNAAVEELLRLHYVNLIRYVRRLIPSDLERVSDEADVIQDVYLEAVRRRRELGVIPVDARYAWLRTIARNRIVDLLRMLRAAKRNGGRTLNEDQLEDFQQSVVLLLRDLAIYARTPSQSALSHELLAQLEEALQSLPGDQREALTRRYMEGQTVSEAAAGMARTEGSIRMLCMRGVEGLRLSLRSHSRFIPRDDASSQ